MSREFLFKKKAEQTVEDVIAYYEERKIEERFPRMNPMNDGFKVRPPEDFFTKELINEAEPIRIKNRMQELQQEIGEADAKLGALKHQYRNLQSKLRKLQSFS